MMPIRRDWARELRFVFTDALDFCDRLGALGEGRRGRDYNPMSDGAMILCPAHAERTPSCHVSHTSKGILWNCHGCGAGGDLYALVAAVKGLDIVADFREVLRETAALAGQTIDDDAGWTPRPLPQRPAPVEPPTLDADTFGAIARTILDAHPIEGDSAVAAYAEQRCLLREMVAEGWAALPSDPRELTALRDRIVAEVGRDAWLASGLAVREGERAGSWLFPQHKLVIPWRARGIQGAVTTLQRRVIGPASSGTPKYVFVSGRRPLDPYGADLADECGGDDVAVYLVEGAVDALALRTILRRAGERGVVLGVPGVSSWSDERAARWGSLCEGRDVLIAFDVESGGRAAQNVEGAAYRIERDLSLVPARSVKRLVPFAGTHDWNDALVAVTKTGSLAPMRAVV